MFLKEDQKLRYVIVSIVKGSAGDFNNKMRKDVFNKFKARFYY